MSKRIASLLVVAAVVVFGTQPLVADTTWNTAIAASSPLDWYQFSSNEANGALVVDHGSGGLDGNFYAGNVPDQSVAGPVGVGGSAQMLGSGTGSGNGNYIVLAGATGSNDVSGSWTAEFIVQPLGTQSNASLLKDPAIDGGSYALKLDVGNTGQPTWALGQVGYTHYGVLDYSMTPGVTAPLNQWDDLVFVGNPSTGVQVYLNGQLAGSNPGYIECPRSQISDAGDHEPSLLADLSQIVIYNQALSATQITAHYDAMQNIPEPSTITLLGCGLIALLAYAWRRRR